jgi:DNA-binding MarR family transcriptional regulator
MVNATVLENQQRGGRRGHRRVIHGVRSAAELTTDNVYARAAAQRCNATAVRQGARYISRFYERYMSGTGLRATQHVVLLLLMSRGSSPITGFAEAMGLERSALGHNLRPLERDGLVTIGPGKGDRRQRFVEITDLGRERLALAEEARQRAERDFEEIFGVDKARELRSMMERLISLELGHAHAPDNPAEETRSTESAGQKALGGEVDRA